MKYESLLKEATYSGIDVYEEPLKGKIQGLYGNNVIWINKFLPTYTDKYCILAEELGHYHKTVGNIQDQTKLTNRKQEQVARSWAYERTIPLHKFVQAHRENIKNRFELSEFLGVTENFLEEALTRYKERYGVAVDLDEHTIYFEPLGVIKWFQKNF
ncbi:protein of unknown function [Gracilibacillus orientalis]|uniref:IrrE N-terminal-like domain-containing protein n=1 Tax=Gracilibacillus orientalis TaxID=334253 RepID=A0A1I4HDH1_9BACI|nr:ImmA/IrrE family metallo-endopeptidase [Gracilibacillus orientalis]SFL39683.1 protein of unknown function [Gracilibacillus orientalis]